MVEIRKKHALQISRFPLVLHQKPLVRTGHRSVW